MFQAGSKGRSAPGSKSEDDEALNAVIYSAGPLRQIHGYTYNISRQVTGHNRL